jgi:AAA+ superfamily predicted ATPase
MAATQTAQPAPAQSEHYDDKLMGYFRAGYPMLYMVTAEEARAEAAIVATAMYTRPDGSPMSGKQRIITWSATTGFFCEQDAKDSKFNNKEAVSPVAAMTWLKGRTLKGASDQLVKSIFIFRDLHAFFPTGEGIKTIRYLRDFYRDFQPSGNVLIVLSPVSRIPLEIQRDFQTIDFRLPNKAQVANIWSRLRDKNKATMQKANLLPSADDEERISDAAMGLTSQEATNAFSLAIIDSASGKGDIANLVLEEKAQAVKKSGILEYYTTNENIDSIGGLDNLKLWLKRRSTAFTVKAREYGLPQPRGALLVGIPGGGKSLSAKASAAIFKVPLIRFDIGRVFGGIVGQSEEQMRNALSTIDAIGPCVVWLDEMEKAFAGASGSGSGDNGVTRRVFGAFLTWMQEKTSPSFVMATANSIIGVPPELLRKGRFDENFYIGLPDELARGAIFKIQLAKVKRTHLKIDFAPLVEKSVQFTGAEIESGIKEGLYLAFGRDRELTTDDILEGISTIKPIVQTQEDEIRAMTKWAEDNAIDASRHSSSEALPGAGGRQLAL